MNVKVRATFSFARSDSAMIQNDQQLQTVKEQLDRVESALCSLKQRLLPGSSATFRLSDPAFRAHDLTCEYDELVEEDVRALLGHPVRVTGTLRASGKTGQQRMEADTIERRAS